MQKWVPTPLRWHRQRPAAACCVPAKPAELNPSEAQGGLRLELGDFSGLQINLTALEDKQIRELQGLGQRSAKLEAEVGGTILPGPRSPLPKPSLHPNPCSTPACPHSASPGGLVGVPLVPSRGQASGGAGQGRLFPPAWVLATCQQPPGVAVFPFPFPARPFPAPCAPSPCPPHSEHPASAPASHPHPLTLHATGATKPPLK